MQQPTDFKGLSIVADDLRRHDGNQLLGGWAGDVLFSEMLFPLTRRTSTVRLLNSPNPYHDDAKVILALGPGCVEAFCNKKNLDLHAARGCPWELNTPEGKKTVVLSYHPQDALDRKNYSGDFEGPDSGDEKDSQTTKRPNWKFWLARDVEKVKRLMRDEWIKPSFEFKEVLRPDLYEVCKILRQCEGRTVFIDIETLPPENIITCVGLSVDDGPVWVIPFMDYRHEWAYGKEIIARFLGVLSLLFQRNTIVAHNGSYDFLILCWKYKIPLPKQARDTMIMHHRMHPDVEKSLAHCGSLYTDLPYHKDEGVFDPRNQAQQQSLWHYNALDVYLTAQIYNRQTWLLDNWFKDYKDSAAQGNSLIRPSLMTTMTGIKLNVDELVVDLERRARWDKQYLRMLRVLAGGSFNPRSPKQVKEYYTDHLGIKGIKSTDEAALLSVHNKTKAPSAKIILAARGNTKLRSSMCFNHWTCPPYGDGRVTTSYAIAGPNTLRFASRTLLSFKGKKGTGWGTNLQNWKKVNRRFCVPDEGKLLVQVDQSGAEAMIVAWLSENGNFRELFKQGIKSHVYVGLHLFAKHWAEKLGVQDIEDYLHAPISSLRSMPYWNDLDKLIKSSGLKYATAKMVCHASNYDMKSPTFQRQAMVKSDNELILTLAECRHYLGTYHTLFPEIRNSYHFDTQNKLKRDRTLVNLFGFPRVFHGPFDDTLWKEGYAFVPQSTSGCLTHQTFVKIQEEIDKRELFDGVDLLQNGHDSVLVQAPKDNAESVAKAISEMFNVTFQGRDETFTMKSEWGIGENWKEMD